MPIVGEALLNDNPLKDFYRLPGVHTKLPTNGAFMPPDSIEFTLSKDIPVYPMRSADEMLLKSPDALMSGYALEELLKSCVPNIKKPRLISSPDLDVLLVAIRAATYGEIISFSPTCPSCGVENETKRNLSYLLTSMTFVDPENVVRLTDDILVYLRPYNLENASIMGLASFEEARKLQAADVSEDESARSKQINLSMKRITDLSEETTADCIIKIIIPDKEVTDTRHILDFTRNISKSWTEKIQAKLEEINKKGIDKSYDLKCGSCEHEWKSEIEFNPSSFFAASS